MKEKLAIGFGVQTEVKPGVWVDVITEKSYKVDISRVSIKQQSGEHLAKDISVLNTFSIVSDPYLHDNLFAMKYVKWMGTRWTISDSDPSTRPRIILRLGGVYNGPTPNP